MKKRGDSNCNKMFKSWHICNNTLELKQCKQVDRGGFATQRILVRRIPIPAVCAGERE